jgi:hypothetical protein
METHPVCPTIHLNGSSATALIEGYAHAAIAVQNAITALDNIEFHRRDYYVQPAGNWQTAVNEMVDRYTRLLSVKAELDAISDALANQ